MPQSSPMQLIMVSGRSGSGKSSALHALEDLGFYCVDNLPTRLIPSLIHEFKDTSPPNADSDDGYALPNYLLCDKDKCMHMTDGKWNSIWDNCTEGGNAPSGHKDTCSNMITTSDMQANTSGDEFDHFECNDEFLSRRLAFGRTC